MRGGKNKQKQERQNNTQLRKQNKKTGANRGFIDKTPINVQDKTRNVTAVAAGNIV